MTPSERDRRQRRAQLRRVQWKLDEHHLSADRGDATDHLRGEQEWQDLVERRIQEAMATGAFDNLPGQGKPLDLVRNPYLDPSLDLAYGLLKSNGYVPEWIGRDQEIRAEIQAARARLRAAWVQHQDNPTDEAAWQASLARFEESLAQINRKIDDFNLVVPISGGERIHLRLADELRRLDDGVLARKACHRPKT